MADVNFVLVGFKAKDALEVGTILKELIDALSAIDVRLFRIKFSEDIPIIRLDNWIGAVPIHRNTSAFFNLSPGTNHMLDGSTSELMENKVFVQGYTHDSVPEWLYNDLSRAFKNVLIERFPHLMKVADWQ